MDRWLLLHRFPDLFGGKLFFVFAFLIRGDGATELGSSGGGCLCLCFPSFYISRSYPTDPFTIILESIDVSELHKARRFTYFEARKLRSVGSLPRFVCAVRDALATSLLACLYCPKLMICSWASIWLSLVNWIKCLDPIFPLLAAERAEKKNFPIYLCPYFPAVLAALRTSMPSSLF